MIHEEVVPTVPDSGPSPLWTVTATSPPSNRPGVS
jgi:hypothetical protein